MRFLSSLSRRKFLQAASGIAAGVCIASRAHAEDRPKEIRIGYQKTTGALLIVKALKLLENKFEPQGISIQWVEFAYGPPLLEAMNAGAIDYGYTGDSPPIFAQAARPNLFYVAATPARGYSQAIITPPESPIASLQDLKGKTVGVGKASSGHNFLLAALESAKVPITDVNIVYLAPADAGAAYARGAIDAWSIWDPFYAIAELGRGARALPVDPNVSRQNTFFLANHDFALRYPAIIKEINEQVSKATQWADAHRDEVAEQFSVATGVSLAVEKKAVSRTEFTFSAVTDEIKKRQQEIADRYLRLGLLSKPIKIEEIVWKES